MQVGFHLKRFVDLTNWKSDAYHDRELQESWVCPSDGTRLVRILALVSLKCKEQVDLCCCPSCGLVTYAQRLSLAALQAYYRTQWMGESEDEVRSKALEHRKAADEWLDQTRAMYDGDTSGAVLEIGVGYGKLVHQLRRSGFSHIYGVEACPVRAHVVRNLYGIDVIEGDFVQLTIDELCYRLPKNQKFSVIHCHHVLEHIGDPGGFICRCFDILEPGGYLCLSLPNFYAEPSMGVALFWPHQFSYTANAITRLLECCGFCVEDVMAGSSLHVTARKSTVPSCRSLEPFVQMNYVQNAIRKLLNGFGFFCVGSDYVLTWQRDFDGAVWEQPSYAQWNTESPFPRKAICRLVNTFKTDAPIEIQFDDRVMLCHK